MICVENIFFFSFFETSQSLLETSLPFPFQSFGDFLAPSFLPSSLISSRPYLALGLACGLQPGLRWRPLPGVPGVGVRRDGGRGDLGLPNLRDEGGRDGVLATGGTLRETGGVRAEPGAERGVGVGVAAAAGRWARSAAGSAGVSPRAARRGGSGRSAGRRGGLAAYSFRQQKAAPWRTRRRMRARSRLSSPDRSEWSPSSRFSSRSSSRSPSSSSAMPSSLSASDNGSPRPRSAESAMEAERGRGLGPRAAR